MLSSKIVPAHGLVLVALLGSATSGLAQSVLLTAGNFVALGGTFISSSGASGTVLSNGNVGLWPTATTAITGFPPAGIVNGAIIATGAATEQASLDLIKVTDALALMPSDTNLSNVDLGGMTLTPGVYTFNGAASLNGALTLDGQGQDDAFWVFQIGTSFITSAHSTVTLVNPGSQLGADYGLFWNAGAEIVIGGGNTLAGNYLSGTSITVGGLSAGGARILALAGIALESNQINVIGGPAGGNWTGGLVYDEVGAIVPVGAIPEPSAFVALAGLATLGCAGLRRRRAVRA